MNPPQKKKILFLYTEIAEYFLSCVRKLKEVGDCDIYIIRWPVNKEAPFHFNFPKGVNIFEKEQLHGENFVRFCHDINPDLIYCSGWIDKDYLKLCRGFNGKTPIILGIDNKWEGRFRQWIAILVSRISIIRYFSYCWVPGNLQRKYALRLGFKKENIFTGFYSADFDLFYNKYIANREGKQKHFPKRFLYVGRYYELKGIKDLWQAFIELQNEIPNDWELWCLGTGDVEPITHHKIKHFGFVQPNDMDRFIKETGVFILSSHFEPWGVVVHEYVSAGFPLICSDEVGSASVFLENGVNGYSYKSGNIKELKNAMKKIINLGDAELIAMGEKSVEKARQITPEKWAKTLLSLVNKD